MRITPFPSRGIICPDTSWALLLLPAFQHQVLDTHSFRGCGLLPQATHGRAEQMHGTVQHEWRNGLSQIKFLQQSLPLLIRESGLFMRDGLDGCPCCAPAVLKRMTSRQCDLGGSTQPCSQWMLPKRETRPAWGHLPMHSLTHER